MLRLLNLVAMKCFALLLALMGVSVLQAQKGTAFNATNEQLFFENAITYQNAAFVSEQQILDAVVSRENYGEDITFEKIQEISSKAFTHYRYQVLKDHKRIFNAVVHFAVDPYGKVRLLELPAHLKTTARSFDFPALSEAAKVQSQIGAQQIDKTEEVWIKEGDDLVAPALLVVVSGPETINREAILYKGEIIHQADLNKHFTTTGPNDTTVFVKVFEPDPLTTAKVSYGAPYADNNDDNVPQLMAQRKVRTTTFTLRNDTIFPENDYVKISDFSDPYLKPVYSLTPQFYFGRIDPGFEDVNAMYHITNYKEHLINIGYPDLPSYQMEVDVHAISGADQSFFSTSNKHLYFGEGGVDDAEDSDVLIHEFSHSVIWEASPSSSVSNERACMEEAICDYFAVSYARTFSLYNKDSVFNWDGHNEFWDGRSVISNKNYGNINFTGYYYSHTDLLASALLSIYDQMGREKTDELVLEALFNLGNNTNMREFAGFMLLSDSALYKGASYSTIYDAFAERGVFAVTGTEEYTAHNNTADITLTGSHGFLQGGSLVLLSQDEFLATAALYHPDGRPVKTIFFSGRSYKEEVRFEGLPGGLYLLEVKDAKGRSRTFKISRL